VVSIEREKKIEPFIPICCWHKHVKNYYIVCVNNPKKIVKKMINSLGVGLYTSFLLFVFFFNIVNLAMEFIQGKRLTCVGCAMLMSAKYKHCFWKRLYEHVDNMYVAKMEETYGVVHIPFGSLVFKQ